MTQKTGNEYIDRMADDNDLCIPVINQKQIYDLLANVDAMIKAMGFSDYSKPKTILDLDQLQVLDYSKLPSLLPEQINYINQSLGKVKADPQDLIFFGLRSLVSFAWELPQSIRDVQIAAAHEIALQTAISHIADTIDYNFWKEDTLLPYWMRLSYLNALSKMPKEVLVEYRLDKVACIPVKNTVFNASSIVYDGNYYISMNYALEPILKFMNRFLVHFFTTRENFAGLKRTQRALDEIAAIIFHFIRNVPANNIFSYSVIYGVDSATSVQWLTADQVEFIFKHEIGHLFYRHPQRLAGVDPAVDNIQARHQFEYEADAFAASMLKMEISATQSHSVVAEDSTIEEKRELKEYIRGFNPVQLLFIYMSFIDKAGDRMRSRLSNICSFVPKNHSHPSPSDRLAKLKQMMPKDVVDQNPLIEYAEKFFNDILQYVDDLEDAELIARMKSFF